MKLDVVKSGLERMRDGVLGMALLVVGCGGDGVVERGADASGDVSDLQDETCEVVKVVLEPMNPAEPDKEHMGQRCLYSGESEEFSFKGMGRARFSAGENGVGVQCDGVKVGVGREVAVDNPGECEVEVL